MSDPQIQRDYQVRGIPDFKDGIIINKSQACILANKLSHTLNGNPI